MHPTLFIAIAFSVLLAMVAPPTQAASITLTADADTSLYQPDIQAPETANGKGAYLFVGRITVGLRRRALLHFPIAASIPPGSTINSVALTLTESRTSGGVVPMTLYRASAAWGEGTWDAGEPGGQGTTPTAGDATWTRRVFPATAWSVPGGDAVASASATALVGAEADYSWTSTPALIADVQLWLAQPAQNFGWLLRADEASSPPTAKRFNSRENTNSATRPRLLIDFTPPLPPVISSVGVPGPGPIALLGLAIAMIALAWRRRLRRT